jgi:hypothetical protein
MKKGKFAIGASIAALVVVGAFAVPTAAMANTESGTYACSGKDRVQVHDSVSTATTQQGGVQIHLVGKSGTGAAFTNTYNHNWPASQPGSHSVSWASDALSGTFTAVTNGSAITSTPTGSCQ